MHTLERIQHLQADIRTVWDFVKAPANLDRITPPWLGFSIVSNVPETMTNGLIVCYRIRLPLLGRQSWVTEIKHIREPHIFVDEQRLGPYRFWYHHHELKPSENGVTMVDTVHYKLPFGPLGNIAHALAVRPALDAIFDYRFKALDHIFNSTQKGHAL